MVFGVIKDYASKALEGIGSAGKSVGGFIKDYHAPILGALEGATGVLKKMEIPIVSGVAKVTHKGLKGLQKMIDEVPNEEAKEKLKEIAKSQTQTNVVPTSSLPGTSSESIVPPHLITPSSVPQQKFSSGPRTKVGQGAVEYGATDITGKVNPYQHNIHNRSRIPYDLVRLQSRVI